MRLNLHILKEDLKHLGFQGELSSDPVVMELAYPLPVRQMPVRPEREVLYIIRAVDLPEEAVQASVLCIGVPPSQWLGQELLYTTQPVEELALLAQVMERFHYYNQWTQRLQQAIDEDLPIQELAERSGEVVGNTIYVQGTFYRVLSQWIPELEDSPFFTAYKEYYATESGCTLSAEEINEMIADPEYNDAIHAVGPTIYRGIPFGYRSLFFNVFVDSTVVARVLFDEIVHPLTNKDFSLIVVFSSYVKKRMMNGDLYYFDRSEDMEEILDCLLSHKLLPEEKIDTFLDNYQWNMEDIYVCFVLKMQSENTQSALQPLALQLAKMLMQDCYMVHGDHVAFVCNLTQLRTSRDELYSTILPYLRDNLLIAGVSTTYRDFKNLYYYYQQALMAERIGKKKNPMHWYFKFEEYQMDYMVQKCTEKTIAQVLVPEGLQALMEYDRERGHSYTETLRLYLEHDRNIAETIRAAYMHRSTFLYQIKRIQEIIKMDLNDPEVRLLLRMAFRILDAGVQ